MICKQLECDCTSCSSDGVQLKKRERGMPLKIEKSSGSVFRDLGFSSKEAESLRLRAELMVEVGRVIKARKLTQSAAAKLFGVTQPRVSDLIRGRSTYSASIRW